MKDYHASSWHSVGGQLRRPLLLLGSEEVSYSRSVDSGKGGEARRQVINISFCNVVAYKFLIILGYSQYSFAEVYSWLEVRADGLK